MKRAFTLIELLIVVAIIAILAAIAVPNFLEAQTRAKVSRTKSDIRTLATAIESYTVDHNRPPIGKNEGRSLSLWTDDTADLLYRQFTTPISYITSPPKDPFGVNRVIFNPTQNNTKGFESYTFESHYGGVWSALRLRGYMWHLRGVGPDGVVGAPYIEAMIVTNRPDNIYDSTNGTISYGNIYRTNKGDLGESWGGG